MPRPSAPKIFYAFARHLIDLTEEGKSTGEEMTLVALDNLPAGDRLAMLRELRDALVHLSSGRYTDRELVDLMWGTGARDIPRQANAFFKAAIIIIDRYIAKGGKPRRYGDEW